MTSVPPRRSYSDYDVSTGGDHEWSLTDRLVSGARKVGGAAQTVGRAAWDIDNAVGSGLTRRGLLRGANLALRGMDAVYDATAGRATDAITSRLGGQDTTGPATSRAAKSFGPPKPTVSSGSTTASVVAARDTQDRQGRFSAPSPARLEERSRIHASGQSARQSYNEMAYARPDVASLGDPVSGYTTKHKAQELEPSPEWRGGSRSRDSTTPTRSMRTPPYPGSPTGMKRRQASTESAFRSADASMLNSAVTPKAAPMKDYKPRGKVTKDKNIQAFY
jgi:hypothetical protein